MPDDDVDEDEDGDLYVKDDPVAAAAADLKADMSIKISEHKRTKITAEDVAVNPW